MKIIFKIARTELQTLFYSPIAWLIMVIFTIQTSMTFINGLENVVNLQELSHHLSNLTSRIFTHPRNGLFTIVQQYLYLYIPLLTMGLMSKEISSGSIKLLYSSPVNNKQIILGKYVAMLVYSLIITFILLIFAIYGLFYVENFDFPAALAGLLGLFLLMSAYASIGLFMSSLTSYQVVAAIGTLAVLALLNIVGNMWQDIALVREITYWLSIRGRSGEFISGLICSEDVLYFLIVIALFLSLTIIRLKALRQKQSFANTFSRYAIAFLFAVVLGYFSARPKLMAYYDATRTKSNTLTENSQEILEKVKGKVTINTYVNILDKYYYLALPKTELRDIKRFKQYLRFKPDMKMKYIRYYDKTTNPSLDKRYPDLNDRERMLEYSRTLRLDSNMFKTPEEIRQIEDLKPEGNRFVRTLVAQNGEKTFLRIFDDMQVLPSEAEISAAFKRLSMKLPQVAFLTGHGERSSTRPRDRDYNKFAQEKPFRYSLINQGFDFRNIRLNKEVPQDIDILIIADPRIPLNPEEEQYLDQYIERGGNLIIASEPASNENTKTITARFGVDIVPGRLVKPTEQFAPDFILAKPTRDGASIMYQLRMMLNRDFVMTMPSASALSYDNNSGYNVTELFVTESQGKIWNETETQNFIDDPISMNPSANEKDLNQAPVVLALNRTVGDKEQKIIILGDADCISNGELSMARTGVDAANYNFILGAFFWLSDEEVPVDVRRPAPTDNTLYVSMSLMRLTKWILIGLLPIIMLLTYIIIWIRRRSH
jgi:ABC-2 type transport system permease protein